MAGMYGKHFADLWAGQPIEAVKVVWADGLAGFSGNEIGLGLEACKRRKFPPTLPEFLELCRPPINAEAAFVEAVQQMRKRHADGSDTWSNPAIYWAARELGDDLFGMTYKALESRWLHELNKAQAKPNVVPAAPKVERLERQEASPEEKAAALERMRDEMRKHGLM